MSASYRGDRIRWWHTVGDAQVGVLVAVVVLGVWTRRPLLVIAVAAGLSCTRFGRRLAIAAAALGVLGVVASTRSWGAATPDRLGPVDDVACLVTDPTPVAGALAAVFEIDGQRFEVFARGSPSRRMASHLAGECATLLGERRALTGTDARRAAIRHVVGRLDIASIGDWTTGAPVARASNRVRRLFADGATELRAPDDALFAGLVIGDDRNEPPAMIDDFRAAGLAHLTAVSGQNVAFVLAAAAPILRRLRPWARWLFTVGLIAWFVALTRFEPSVLRAGTMAAIGATGVVLGREKPPGRVLGLAVGLLVLIDPMLVWSVGFWLSVSATAGVALLASRLARFVPGPDWMSIPVGVTLGAQLGVAPVSLLVFGSLPLVSLPANLLAVPVAGAVMLYGLPAGLVAGAVHDTVVHGLAGVVQLPSAAGTRWVSTVAALGARVEPSPVVALAGWSIVAAALIARFFSVRRRPVCQGVG